MWAGQQCTPVAVAAGDSAAGLQWPVRRPGGRAAAYPWRGCRRIAGQRPRRPGGGERGKRPVAALPALVRRAGASSAGGGGSWRSARSSPSTRAACTWRRGTARLRGRVGRAGAAGEYRRPDLERLGTAEPSRQRNRLFGSGPRGEPGAGMTGTPGSEGGSGKRARREASTAPRADPATGDARIVGSTSGRPTPPSDPPALASTPRGVRRRDALGG